MTEHRPVGKGSYLPTLDGWRGIAILAVISSHVRWPVPWVARIAQYGPMGVHLFFALSGFLITWRLIEEHDRTGKVDFANFYRRRAFRILPAAFAYLLAISILGFALHRVPLTRLEVAGSALFFRNYLSPASESWYTIHFWSLSVEEHFYLLWPALLFLAGFRRARFLAPALALAVGLWRFLDERHNWVATLDPILKDNVRRTDYRLDILLFGCAAALLWREPFLRRLLKRFAGTGLVLAALAATVACLYWTPPGYLTLLAILMAVLPAATVARPSSLAGRVLEFPPLRWIGLISYSLYLWQEIFFPGLPPALGLVQRIPWNFAAAFTAAACSYYLIERPMIRFGKTARKRRD